MKHFLVLSGFCLTLVLSSFHHHGVTRVTPQAQLSSRTSSWMRKLNDALSNESANQQTLMAEKYLEHIFEKEEQGQFCTQRYFCEVATTNKGGFSVEDAVIARNVMTTLKATLGQVEARTGTKFKHIFNLVAAFDLGNTNDDLEMCRRVFTPCQVPAERVTCPQTSMLCPGVSISCGLCGMFTPATCAFVCPVAAIYCGVAGYSCPKPDKEPQRKPRMAKQLPGMLAEKFALKEPEFVKLLQDKNETIKDHSEMMLNDEPNDDVEDKKKPSMMKPKKEPAATKKSFF